MANREKREAEVSVADSQRPALQNQVSWEQGNIRQVEGRTIVHREVAEIVPHLLYSYFEQ